MKHYEVKVVHPAVEQWLISNDCTVQHHYDTGDGIIDFISHHPELGGMIVECKSDCGNIQSAIMQVLYYCRLLGDIHLPAIAVPLHTITRPVQEKLNRLKIKLITVDVPAKESTPENSKIGIFVFCLIEAITQHHYKTRTSPASDYGKVMAMIFQFAKGDERVYLPERVIEAVIRSAAWCDDEPAPTNLSWFLTDEAKDIYTGEWRKW